MSDDNKKWYSGKPVEERILKLIETTNLPPWKCPWIFTGYDVSLTGNTYTGTNAVMLSMTRSLKGQKSRVWMTFAMVKALKGKIWNQEERKWVKDTSPTANDHIPYIRPGAEGVPVIYPLTYTRKNKKTGEAYLDKDGNEVTFTKIKSVYVFNADDIVNFDSKPFEPEMATTGICVESCEEFEKMILGSYKNHPEIVYGGNKAAYSFTNDKVFMPPIRRFLNVEQYASTLAHELAHSTGNRARLRRICTAQGEDDYSREELVAEFASAIVLAHYGMDSQSVIENCAVYIDSWLDSLRGNPGMLMESISDAYRAAAMILGQKKDYKD